jgi:hypothetical protein
VTAAGSEAGWFHDAELALARRDAAWQGGLAELLDDAFLEHGASGRTWTRDEIVPFLEAEPTSAIELVDFAVHELAPDVVLVTYTAVAPGADRRMARRASIWCRREGSWRMRFHQGTPVPASTGGA